MVTKIAEAAMEASSVVILDVKNAFNSANCCKIIEALETLGIPKHLVPIVIKFLCKRLLCYDLDDDPK